MKKILVLFSILLIMISIISGCKKVAELTIYRVDSSSCNSCGDCLDVCPNDAIELIENNKAVIDQSKCVQCGDCILVCPQEAIQ